MARAYSTPPTRITRRNPTAAWDIDTLVGALARRGWGPIAAETQGVRTVLRALVDVLPHGSAEGRATAHQLADVTGLSERWVRRCLARLEQVGLVQWTRGWIERGRKVPSLFRISKRTIAAWVRAAAGDLDERRTERAEQAAERLAALRSTTVPPRRRKPRPAAPQPAPERSGTELRPSPHEEVTGRAAEPVPLAAGIAMCRDLLATARAATTNRKATR
ncbi:hypothetical protein AADG42_18245 [Ammonicoccus fulvus]|uniref:Helix-turn-helix domain-containing protein n=1 Tax=Ammonicoccus fulvus TaxID=3138240 RepID=A0ABZ3FSV3_9ACTN